jgi:hypothetical protein
MVFINIDIGFWGYISGVAKMKTEKCKNPVQTVHLVQMVQKNQLNPGSDILYYKKNKTTRRL